MKSISWDGKIISEPGIYSNIPISIYHSQRLFDGPSVSSSGLRRALEINGGSPAHFYAEWSGNPKFEEPTDTKAFVLGRAAHHLMLGQPHFATLFAIRPDELPDPKTGEMKPWHGSRTVCREWISDAEARGRTVLTPDDVESIKGMAVSLGKHPLLSGHGLLSGDAERSLFWKDQASGIWLKSRPDAIPTDSGDISDLKTVTSVQWYDLMRSIGDWAYHQQAALVRDAIKTCCEIELASFSLVFVEKSAPYCCRVVMLKDEDLDLGAKQNRRALDTIARCISENRWPGPGEDDVNYIDLPDYYRTRATEALNG